MASHGNGQALATTYRFTRANTVSVGDSLEDVRTAQLGGCRLLAVASGTTPADELRGAGADVVFEDLRDTAAVVAALAELGAEESAESESARHTPSAQLAWPRSEVRSAGGEKRLAPTGPRVVVLGTLNTDISVIGVPSLPGPDEDAFGPRLAIAAGGKARNAAEMLARLLGPGSVTFVGRTVRDRFGLWRVPYDALRSAGVDTRFIRITSAADESGAPAVALVAVDVDSRHSSSVNTEPGQFLDRSRHRCCICGLRGRFGPRRPGGDVLGDAWARGRARGSRPPPGARCESSSTLGVGPARPQYIPEFARDIFLIKPNALEAQRLTGVEIDGFAAAGAAADRLILQGVRNVLITDGMNGAYLFGDGLREHIEAPSIESAGQLDSTGCGDQVMAALCAMLCSGWDLAEAAGLAVRAGTMQFHRAGVRPLSLDEIAGAEPGSVDRVQRLPGDQV